MNKIDELMEDVELSELFEERYEDSEGSLDEGISSTTTFTEYLIMQEANIEIKDPNGKDITIDGKPYSGGIGGIKTDYPKHFSALKAQLAKDGKSLRNFGGNNPAVDISARADGTIVVNYDA